MRGARGSRGPSSTFLHRARGASARDDPLPIGDAGTERVAAGHQGDERQRVSANLRSLVALLAPRPAGPLVAGDPARPSRMASFCGSVARISEVFSSDASPPSRADAVRGRGGERGRAPPRRARRGRRPAGRGLRQRPSPRRGPRPSSSSTPGASRATSAGSTPSPASRRLPDLRRQLGSHFSNSGLRGARSSTQASSGLPTASRLLLVGFFSWASALLVRLAAAPPPPFCRTVLSRSHWMPAERPCPRPGSSR